MPQQAPAFTNNYILKHANIRERNRTIDVCTYGLQINAGSEDRKGKTGSSEGVGKKRQQWQQVNNTGIGWVVRAEERRCEPVAEG